MKKILIDCGQVTVLIAAAPTGVTYTNQAGGVACTHPEIEGFAIPLQPLKIDACCFGKYGGSRIPNEVADHVEAVMKHADYYICHFRVDRDCEEQQEAWIWCEWDMVVSTDYSTSPHTVELRHFRGVVAYENCD